jgi:hypothetical protein
VKEHRKMADSRTAWGKNIFFEEHREHAGKHITALRRMYVA